MKAITGLLSRRSSKFVLSILLLVSLVSTQIPLLNYLGFEFSTLISVLAGLMIGLWVVGFSLRGRRPGNPSQIVNSSDAAPDVEFWTLVRQSATFATIALLIPLVVLTGNAVFVKNCSLFSGFLFYLLIPLPGVFFSVALALLASASFKRLRRTIFAALYFIILLYIAAVTFTGPQIFAFNPIVGYFPGITYDESLEFVDRLLLYRAGTIVASVALLLLALAIWRRSRSYSADKPSASLLLSARELAVLTICVLTVTLLFFFSNKLGLSSSESQIKSSLGGVYETEHFVLVYPIDSVNGKQAGEIADLLEFYYFQLTRALRVQPVKKITTFLYRSVGQKERLVGAGRTNIAKPWLWQLHLNLSDINTSLRHELVHVMAAEFGFPLLRVGWNPGLIEGLAVAVERVSYDEPIHQLAAMMYATGADPDIQSLFSVSGFFKAQQTVSYTLAGSFCRFLIDRYGLRRFKFVYRTGDFRGFYNRDLSSLLSEWRRFLSRYRFDESQKEKGAYLFRRPTIFAKECARVIASLNNETRRLAEEKNYAAALASADRSLELSTSIEAVLQRAVLLFKLQRFDEVIRFGEEKLADTSIAHTLLPLKLTVADAFLATGELTRARQLYEEILSTHLSLLWDETSAIRLELLRDSLLVQEMQPYLTSGLDDSLRLDLLKIVSKSHPRASLPQYLLGRELASKEKYDEAVQQLVKGGAIGGVILEFTRQRRIGQLYFRLHQFERAKTYFWQALNYTDREARILEIREWLERCDWMEERERGGI